MISELVKRNFATKMKHWDMPMLRPSSINLLENSHFILNVLIKSINYSFFRGFMSAAIEPMLPGGGGGRVSGRLGPRGGES